MAKIAAVAVGAGQAIKAYKTRNTKMKEAEAYLDAKDRRMAATTREMAEEERNKEFVYSRALALAAASGAGTEGASMVKLFGDLNAEGEYRVMSRLWAGQNDAEGLIFRSEAAQKEADTAMTVGAIDSVVSAYSTYHALK